MSSWLRIGMQSINAPVEEYAGKNLVQERKYRMFKLSKAAPFAMEKCDLLFFK